MGCCGNGCEGCDGLGVAIGSPGQTGPAGPTGATGATGASGNICGTLYGDITGVVGGNSLTVVATGGSGIYTYLWSNEQNSIFGQTIIGSTTGASISVTAPGGPATSCLFKCKITDSNGCITSAYFTNITPGS